MTPSPYPLRRNLTFGIELEFVLATVPAGNPDPHPEDPRQVYFHDPNEPANPPSTPSTFIYTILKHVAQTLTQHHVPAIPILKRSQTTSFSHNWLVKTDASIQPPDPTSALYPYAYRWYAVEVVSPAYYHKRTTTDACRKVIRILREQYRMVVNSSCGLHVHVGNGLDGLNGTWLRNLMAVLWTFEPQLESLFPAHRKPRPGQGAEFNFALSCASVLAAQADAQTIGEGRTLAWLTAQQKREWGLEQILAQRDEAELCALMASQYGAAIKCLPYHIQGLNPRDKSAGVEGSKKTIEFRQHEGTMDEEAVVMWVETVVMIVEFARDVREETVLAWLRECVRLEEGRFGVVRFLLAIGACLQARYYGKKVWERREREQGVRRVMVGDGRED
ncbi:hypothetical protein BP6252_12611 [Coleophoma cylindrospora]|uniref:Amidoligase enzyme-domain-containing protein n=1 Tax=Coleophoma cylindrospora TaxID=1849047 RepID=A0A3D8QDM0_9HELO|nr:hypothetical protein BP6252_12611 [Coleophoma cylindrospora]